MIIWLILTIVFITSFIKANPNESIPSKIFLGFIATALSSGITVFVCLFLAFSFGQTVPQEKTVTYLEQLNDNIGVNGTFFLGTGNIDNELFFTYYAKNGNSYSFNKIKADKVTIRYTNSTPKLIEIYDDLEDSFWSDYFYGVPNGHWSLNEHYIFEVPKGSIQNSYKLNGK